MERKKLSLGVFLLAIITLTTVGVKGQVDLKNSAGFWGLPVQDRLMSVAEYLANNNDMTRKLMKIAESLEWLVESTNGDPEGSAFMPAALDALPGVFSSNLFKLVVYIGMDEVKRVNVSEGSEAYEQLVNSTQLKMMEFVEAHPNATEAERKQTMAEIMKNLVMDYKLKHTSWARAVNRVFSYASARDFLPPAPNATTVNPQCYSDTMDFLDAIVGTHPVNESVDITHPAWALRMLDSFGKPSGGILKGAIHFVGSYDECLSVHAYLEDDPDMRLGHRPHDYVTEFDTRFCRVTFDLPPAIAKSFGVDTRGIELRLHWGTCFPDTCHSEDVAAMFQLGALAQFKIPVHNVYCTEEKHIEEDASAMTGLVLLSVLVATVVFCSLVEAAIIFYNNNLAPSYPTPTNSSIEEGTGATVVYENAAYMPEPDEKKLPISSKAARSAAEPIAVLGYMHHKEGLPEFKDQLTASSSNSGGVGVQQETPTPPPSYKETEKRKGEKNKHEKVVPALVKAFSVLTNMPRILSGKKSKNAIHCLHGIRFFSLSWVILGHTYNYGVISADHPTTVNLIDADTIFKRFTFQGIMAGGYAVDTFFLLSGLLVTYLTLKDMAKKKFNCSYWVMFYVHRFWRLTPLYMVVLMLFTCLHVYLGGGPLWPERLGAAMNCRQYWWTNMLYVNNLVHVDDMCMGWTWYLSNDMQFYVITPLFLLPLFYFAGLGMILVVALVLLGIGCTFYFELKNGGDIFTMLEEDSKYWEEVYVVPWCRVGAYAVGMMLGYIFYKTKQTTLTLVETVAGWLVTWGVGLFLCYITYTDRREGATPWTLIEHTFYESLGRPLWAMCVGWIIYACHNNRGGFINTILSWEGFLPLSRLTYAAYLIHPIVMMLHLYSKKALIYIDDLGMAYLFMGHAVTSFLAAFFLSVACEAPALALEKMLFRLR